MLDAVLLLKEERRTTFSVFYWFSI